jgi:mRNA interferase MazF
MKEIRRGDILYVFLKENRKCSVISGLRPCIVISNNQCNSSSETINVIPLSKKKKDSPVHVEITPEDVKGRLKEISYCMAEQIQTVDKAWCEAKIGHVPAGSTKMVEINAAVRRQLGMAGHL